VSVIVPAYNSADFLPDAVESIRRQSYPHLEIIIVDDGSTDGTANVVQNLNDRDLRYVYQPNGGPARARNYGLRIARGEVIAFLDADDLWPPGRVRCQLRYLERNPQAEVVLGRVQCVRSLPHAGGGADFEICSPAFVILSPTTALFRRTVFNRIGGFDETLRYGEDTDWFMRAREQRVPIVVHDDVTLLYRRHHNNMTRGRDVKELQVMSVLKKSLDRRRRQQGAPQPLPSMFEFLDRDGRSTDRSKPPQDT
jgi:glycosyltransferase involved in cell wall biosynthesis